MHGKTPVLNSLFNKVAGLKARTAFFKKFFIRTPPVVTFERAKEKNGTEKVFNVELSPSKKNLFYILERKTFKNNETYFFFHLKSSFCSQDF